METCIDRESLYNALDNLPSDLYDTYSRIMDRIPNGYKSKTIRVLQFLTYSGRPLRVEELIDAIAVRLEKPICFDPIDRMPEPKEIARYCSSLTKFVAKNGAEDDELKKELHLAHFSVKEYLASSSERFNETAARASIAKVCISYLRHVDPKMDKRQKRNDRKTILRTKFPFFEYSTKSWMVHAAATEKQDKTVFNMALDLLINFDEDYYDNWIFLYQYDAYPEQRSPIWHACNAGISIRCLERLLEYGKDKGLNVHEKK